VCTARIGWFVLTTCLGPGMMSIGEGCNEAKTNVKISNRRPFPKRAVANDFIGLKLPFVM
jgi:hypothetical protein